MQTTKKFHILPNNSVSSSMVFEPSGYSNRLEELYKQIVNILALEEMQQIAMEAKKRFETPPPYDYTFPQLEERFGRQAMAEARAILEEERRLVVENMAPYIKATLENLIPRLRNIVFGVDKKGKPFKRKIRVAKMTVEDGSGKGNYIVTDVQSFDGDIEAFQHYERLASRVGEFNAYASYMPSDLAQLYAEARDLCSLEIERMADAPQKQTA